MNTYTVLEKYAAMKRENKNPRVAVVYDGKLRFMGAGSRGNGIILLPVEQNIREPKWLNMKEALKAADKVLVNDEDIVFAELQYWKANVFNRYLIYLKDKGELLLLC